jgi:hypothetical protein
MATCRAIRVTQVNEELWLPLPYGNNYSISSMGNVYSTYVRRNLQPYEDKDGYRCIDLYQHSICIKKGKVHRLVLEAFVGPCPLGMESYHEDNDRANNRLDNLKWATPSENKKFIVISGNHPQSNKVRCPENHLLIIPNLDHSRLKQGHRKCKSCEYGRQAYRFNKSRDRVEEANKYYAALQIE